MFWIKSVLESVVIVTCVIKLSSALECYECESEKNPACGDPFDSAELGKSSEPQRCTEAKEKSDRWDNLNSTQLKIKHLVMYEAAVCYKRKYADGRGNN